MAENGALPEKIRDDAETTTGVHRILGSHEGRITSLDGSIVQLLGMLARREDSLMKITEGVSQLAVKLDRLSDDLRVHNAESITRWNGIDARVQTFEVTRHEERGAKRITGEAYSGYLRPMLLLGLLALMGAAGAWVMHLAGNGGKP